jgi:hypothetical protein
VRRCTQGIAPLFSLDLHVLGTPPALILSQDQTLKVNLMRLIFIALKTELTREILLSVRFLFSKNLTALRPQT